MEFINSKFDGFFSKFPEIPVIDQTRFYLDCTDGWEVFNYPYIGCNILAVKQTETWCAFVASSKFYYQLLASFKRGIVVSMSNPPSLIIPDAREIQTFGDVLVQPLKLPTTLESLAKKKYGQLDYLMKLNPGLSMDTPLSDCKIFEPKMQFDQKFWPSLNEFIVNFKKFFNVSHVQLLDANNTSTVVEPGKLYCPCYKHISVMVACRKSSNTTIDVILKQIFEEIKPRESIKPNFTNSLIFVPNYKFNRFFKTN